MILKTLTRRDEDYSSLIRYIMKPLDHLSPKQRREMVFKNNVFGSEDEWVSQFRHNETFRKYKRRDSIKMCHEIISWHPKDADKITPEFLRSFMKLYTSIRCERPMFIAALHKEEHVHLHILLSGLNFKTGYSVSRKRADYLAMIRSLQNYHLTHFPEITHSTVPFDGSKRSRTIDSNEYMYTKRTGRPSRKAVLSQKLQELYTQSHSLSEFLALVEKEGYSVYYRRGKPTGVVTATHRKHRFENLSISKEQLAALDRQHESQLDGQLVSPIQKTPLTKAQLHRLRRLQERRRRSTEIEGRER